MGAIPVTLPPSVVGCTFDCVTLPELVSTIFRQMLPGFVQLMEPTNNCAFDPITRRPWVPSEIWTEVATAMVVVLTTVSCPQLGARTPRFAGRLAPQLFCGAGGVPA